MKRVPVRNILRTICMWLTSSGLFLWAGCSYQTETDFIPKKTGVSDDGLWLCLGAERMRSDGSEREALPIQRMLGGAEAEISKTLVRAETHKLFYVLNHETEQGLFCYDLAEEETKELIPNGKNIRITESDSNLFVEAVVSLQGALCSRQFLFNSEGDLLFEGVGYTFSVRGGVMHCSEFGEEETTFRWWRETLHSVSLPKMSFDSGSAARFIDSDYAYFLYEDASLRAVNLDTGELKEDALPLLTDGVPAPWSDYSIHAVGGYPFCIADNGEVCALYTLKNGACVEVCSVEKNKNPGITFHGGAESGVLCFKISQRRLWAEVFEYVIFDSDLSFRVVGEKEHDHKESLPVFTCGEYTFWVEQKSWSPGLMMSHKYCLYLWRQKENDAPEIMQYSFAGADFLFGKQQPYYYFFDDILPD